MRLLSFALLVLLAVSTQSCQRAPADPPAKIQTRQTAPAAAPGSESVTDQNPPPHSVAPVIRANMSAEFLNAFMDSKECRGIRLSTGSEKPAPDFRVQTSFGIADTPEMEEQWTWTMFDMRNDARGEFRAAGNQSTAAYAVRDMCLDLWESFKAPGGQGK